MSRWSALLSTQPPYGIINNAVPAAVAALPLYNSRIFLSALLCSALLCSVVYVWLSCSSFFSFMYVCMTINSYTSPPSVSTAFSQWRRWEFYCWIYVYISTLRACVRRFWLSHVLLLLFYVIFLFIFSFLLCALRLFIFCRLMRSWLSCLSLSLSLPSQPRMLFYTHILVYYYYYYTEQYNKRANIKSVRQCPIPVWWWYTVGYYYFLLILTLYLFSPVQRGQTD